MANGLAKGFTRIANRVLADIMKAGLTKRELLVLLWVIRNGYGFNKEQSACDLDPGKISDDTSLDRSHVWKTLHQLESKNVLMLSKTEIRFNRHSSQWTVSESAHNNSRLKQPQTMAETAMNHSQNGLRKDDKPLSLSDLEGSKEKIKQKDTPKSPPEDQQIGSIHANQRVKTIIALLNSTTGKSFKPTAKQNQTPIRARLNEGFTVEDFEAVIKVKSDQWQGDPRMDRYLRPQTLFSNKFEGYLQESRRVSTSQVAFGFEESDTKTRGYGS